ncbi:molybdopterin oxidoreductase family protein [Pseudonocardiaceae bacterium YIM PH 21723]|nr:molybdopterin oxidoreductase family protein [Pseudonocardiaceae bacterium YIM PH 21723]
MTETWAKTACILCECNCGLEVLAKDRTLLKIRGDKEHPGSAGYTCEKPLRLERYQNGSHRISSPMRRREDGTYEEIDWDTAITEIAAKLAQIKETHGGDKIFFYGGGGQGNHLGGAHSRALMSALGVRYISNALAQEKTGEMWVDGKLYGGHTKGDFEHSEVVLFLGKNPWQSHSFPRTRPTLREIAKDPARSMIVVDPRRSETAEMADFHLQVRPGTDAWCLAALLGILVEEELLDQEFIAEHTTGTDPVLDLLRQVPISDYAARCGVAEELLRATARRIGAAKSVTTYEDLGIQQAPNSTLVSYLNKLTWILTGNFGKPGAMYLHSAFAAVAGGGAKPKKVTPVTGARIIAGLIPCNSITEEILTDHPDRFRAMWMDSVNPAHSLADSQRFREAMRSLELTVVIDVAFTETARNADYVLPASSQFEKWEATFFNVEFPVNTFQLRPPVFDPLPGTLPEAEIYARLLRELQAADQELLDSLTAAAHAGRAEFTAAFFTALGQNPKLMGLSPYLLHETLGTALPEGQRGAAIVWGLAQICAMTNADAVRRAGFADGNALFDGIIAAPQGVKFTVDEWEHVWNYVRRPDRRFTVEIPELLEKLDELRTAPVPGVSTEFPLVLSAGERRAFTANTIIRDPEWRRRDAGGALRISPQDAEELGLTSGDSVRVITEAGSAETGIEITDMMRAGHISLPNGMGVDHPDHGLVGVPLNELTSLRHKDEFAGTPWHKYVPARVEKV